MIKKAAARTLLGRVEDPTWARPALLTLLIATGVLYLWGLGASGWANSYYSAAVQAGATSWHAFFFGSFDGASFITVDKTPASLWVMALSARIFGVNAWSVLVPQALEGVATVGVLYATVRRWAGPGAAGALGPAAGLLAGAVAATTPVAVLMFRFNNPDALLVLLMTVGAYCVTRALETASGRWLALAGVAIGFGFLTKMLQAFLVVPGFALVYLIAAPTSFWRRLRHTLLAGLAVVASAGWWVAIVELTPARYRPYIGGSQNDSVLELTLGYNGMGRLTGEETGSVGGRMGWGTPGITRLFGDDMGGQAAWLLPAALVLLVAGLAFTIRASRTDSERASYLLWGGWLLANGLTFSLMKGIVHAYYTVALAPAIGALVGIGTVALLRRRSPLAGAALAAAIGVTAWCASTLLARTPDWYPPLRWAIIVTAAIAGTLALLDGVLARRIEGTRVHRALPGAVAVLGIAAALAGPVAYALQTAATAHTGAIPSAGPGGWGHGGRGPGGGRMVTAGPGGRQGAAGALARNGAGLPDGAGAPPGRDGGQNQWVPRGRDGAAAGNGAPPQGAPGARAAGTNAGQPGGLGAGPGGLLDARTPSSQLTATLRTDADDFTWIAAAVGANNAAGYQLATGEPVLAIGGFNGSDAAPTLAEFQRYVSEKKIHYFVGGGGMRPDSGSDHGQRISTWVTEHFASVTVDGTTLYDLTRQTS